MERQTSLSQFEYCSSFCFIIILLELNTTRSIGEFLASDLMYRKSVSLNYVRQGDCHSLAYSQMTPALLPLELKCRPLDCGNFPRATPQDWTFISLDNIFIHFCGFF